jgi:hypothetical protein
VVTSELGEIPDLTPLGLAFPDSAGYSVTIAGLGPYSARLKGLHPGHVSAYYVLPRLSGTIGTHDYPRAGLDRSTVEALDDEQLERRLSGGPKHARGDGRVPNRRDA